MAVDQSYVVPAPEQQAATAASHALPSSRSAKRAAHRVLQGRAWTALRVAFDALLLTSAVATAVLPAPGANVGETWFALLLAPLTILMLAIVGHYRDLLQVRIIDGLGRALGITTLAAGGLITTAALAAPALEANELIVHAWAFGSVNLLSARAFTNWVRRRARGSGAVATPTLIVGAGQIGALVEKRLTGEPELGLCPVGYLDADPPSAEDVPLRTAPVLGDPDELARVAEDTGAGHVVLGFTRQPDSELFALVRECEARGLAVSVVPRLYEFVSVHSALEHIGGLPLFSFDSVDPKSARFAIKHAFDRVAAAVMLLVLSPVMVGVALAVKLTSPGPVLFRQRRIGRDGREFNLLKFRSMRMAEPTNGAGPVVLRPADTAPGGVDGHDRRTALGRFLRRNSVDELPQLLNVVRGEMSLVGPRPERTEFVELFEQRVRRYEDRHRVKSGITGWAQIHGLRGATSLTDRVELDNHYIANWSLSLDLKILLLTLSAVLMSGREE